MQRMRVTKASAGESVYERLGGWPGLAAAAFLVAVFGVTAAPRPAAAQDPNATVLDAREAFRKRDRTRLAVLKAQAAAEANPLAQWVEYWELTNRISEAQQPELTAFADRWSGSYVEDRLRNDWLRELGRRRDWANFSAEFPRFRMNDDREVTCYWLVTEHLGGRDIKATGLAAWLAQKDDDDGCAVLAATLYDAQKLSPADVWKKIRLSMEANRPRAARQAAGLLGPGITASVGEIVDGPAKYLAKKTPIAARRRSRRRSR